MFNQNSGYSLADIAAVAGGNNGLFGDGNGGGAWWILLLFLFAFGGFGWGNNGEGGFTRPWGAPASNSGATTRAEITYGLDMSGLKSGITDLGSQMKDGFYALNTGLLEGFAGSTAAVTNGIQAIQTDICNLGLTNLQNTNTIISAINADTIANMQNTFGITTQLNAMANQQQNCCCETQRQLERDFADLNYNLATQECDTRRSITDGVRDIIDTNNANTRSILDFLVQDRITALTNENSALKTQISQSEQNAYLVSQLAPKASPAYVVANPYTGAIYPLTTYGSGYGCNCNCGMGCGC